MPRFAINGGPCPVKPRASYTHTYTRENARLPRASAKAGRLCSLLSLASRGEFAGSFSGACARIEFESENARTPALHTGGKGDRYRARARSGEGRTRVNAAIPRRRRFLRAGRRARRASYMPRDPRYTAGGEEVAGLLRGAY